MTYEHWTMRDEPPQERDSRPTVTIVLAVVLVVASVLLFVVLSGGDDGLDAVPAPVVESSSVTTTTAPAAPLAPETGAQDIPSGGFVGPDLGEPATVPPSSAELDVDAETEAELDPGTVGDAQSALDDLADSELATSVTLPVRKFGGTYAVIVVGGTARLLQWDGENWNEVEELRTPSAVREVSATDVTGDGTSDFVVHLDNAANSGGVFNNTGTRWDWVPFASSSGAVSFVDGLEDLGGRLRSFVADSSGRSQIADWRWDGYEFSTF